jgi:general secretion pathway protein A
MYEQHFGLCERPFELTPNPRYLVLTPSHEEALGNLEYAIASRKGITVLLGEAGTGKTTLLRKALTLKLCPNDPANAGLVYLNNPMLARREFFELLVDSFRLGADARASKAQFLLELQRLLAERHRRGLFSALILDEAQALPDHLLEELRLLANIESETHKLLPLVLAGQPEFADRLNDPRLRQFKQRIALRCHLSPLTLRETASYIAARIRLAGGDPVEIFTRDAIIAVYEASGGIPRTIGVICDNAMLAGFADDIRPVDASTVRAVCAEFDLRVPDGVARPGPAAGPTSPIADRPPTRFGIDVTRKKG